MSELEKILEKEDFSKEDLLRLLSAKPGAETNLVLAKALEVKAKTVGRNVYLRGLIELSNVCSNNCYYCGIRAANKFVERYTLSEEQVLDAAVFAWEQGFGSLVIQTGEQRGPKFVNCIDDLLRKIHKLTNNELSITLSCGEQPLKVYKQWIEAGAHRYLFRIETTNPELYYKIHPNDKHHAFENRLKALQDLRTAGYQVGTGVMIGLPGQTLSDLADDLLFFKSIDIDMVGMGPYIEHADTPLYAYAHELLPTEERFRLGLLMIAVLRLMMPYINIAASTALETLDDLGRQKGILAGANVVMPNLTPVTNRKQYLLYDNKPNLEKDATLSTRSVSATIEEIGESICLYKLVASIHFVRRTQD